MSEVEKLRALADAIEYRQKVEGWIAQHGCRESQRLEHFNWKLGATADGAQEIRHGLIEHIEANWEGLLAMVADTARHKEAARRAALEEG